MKKNLELKKYLNDLDREARKNIKVENCLLCGNPMTSPCDSHVVPKFILKEISKNGMISYGKTLANDELLDITKGVSNVYNFKLICRKCDTEFFKNYESKESILNFDSYDLKDKNKMLTSMAIKSHLTRLYMRAITESYMGMIFEKYPKLKKHIVLEKLI